MFKALSRGLTKPTWPYFLLLNYFLLQLRTFCQILMIALTVQSLLISFLCSNTAAFLLPLSYCRLIFPLNCKWHSKLPNVSAVLWANVCYFFKCFSYDTTKASTFFGQKERWPYTHILNLPWFQLYWAKSTLNRSLIGSSFLVKILTFPPDILVEETWLR